MKKTIIFTTLLFLMICGILIAIAPDSISLTVTSIMGLIVLFGVLFGLVPNLLYSSGFVNGRKSIAKAKEANANNIWTAVSNVTPFFNQKTLDELFENYLENVKEQEKQGVVISDIEDVINEDSIALRSWRGVVLQISGTLTSLGLLGTFLGLTVGVSNVTFKTVELTMSSIENLLSGITTAFYTSIVGVILSILFNVAYRLIWNIMLREMYIFTESFHSKIQPTAEEQINATQYLNSEKMITVLDDIRDDSRARLYMAGNDKVQEQRMMMDILSGVERGEFSYSLIPVVDLSTKQIVKAQSIMRWNHDVLGVIQPSVYMPVVEANGYGVKLDCDLWKNICETVSAWKSKGNHPVPVILNVSKIDLMALDVCEYITDLTEKYSIEPRYIEIAIAAECYSSCGTEVLNTEKQLLKKGFRICVSNFNGSFFELEESSSDEVRYNMENSRDTNNIRNIFEQARNAHINLTAENVTSAKQLAALIKSGCKYGQGRHFYEEMTKEEFEKLMQYN